jgi:long-chain acyl-CoA synthetase
VATLGINSVRYFALDVAIGLVGAVSVPIYYTSSTVDVVSLVTGSGARTLFVGTDRMLDELDLAQVKAHIVSISDRENLRPGIQSWKEFVALGERSSNGDAASADAWLPYVSLDSLATIRYTSGTTGLPKGVTFTQQQVRWMGEVMPAVLDWRTRMSGRVRYLSFLPMSHVVEGILVAYAPYYILGNIEMYYLNDFAKLAEALPKVRPNLFFSVPRFYEKVWNQFSSTGAGKFWIGLPDGMVKQLLAYPLRYVILRRAGLDRCRQLIVGSAPIGMELLESFRSLGIEIHNAFGVTEAPLITLSRLGNNELGSVGQLLPNTEARLDQEGLVYVRGPQVTQHYDGVDEPALDADGWFCTGDLGSWSPRGNLVLSGRKKEILVTSYGKNIAPQKIEVLLKGVDGVSEAMVVADGKPFTSALLWLEDEVMDAIAHGVGFDFASLDAAVRRINEELSHPEQVKRWVVCARPLTVAAGELTPNLKLRRNNVAETRSAAIDVMYGAWDAPNASKFDDDILYGGEA